MKLVEVFSSLHVDYLLVVLGGDFLFRIIHLGYASHEDMHRICNLNRNIRTGKVLISTDSPIESRHQFNCLDTP